MTDLLANLMRGMGGNSSQPKPGSIPPNISGLPVLNITTQTVQLPIQGGVTVLNTGDEVINLSTDAIPSASNTFQLAVNGALPIPANAGPLWASVTTGMGQVVVLNKEYNITNPLVSIQKNAIDFLGFFNASASTIVNQTFTALQDYEAIAIQGAAFNVGGPLLYCAEIVNVDPTSLFGANIVSPFGFKNPGITQHSQRCIVPNSINQGEQFSINLYTQSGIAAGIVGVYGITTNLSIPLRPDGRTYPIGTYTAVNFVSSSGSTTLVNAPIVTGLRIYIKKAGARCPSADFVDLTGSVNGASCELIGVGTAGGQLAIDSTSGILLDPNTAVTFNVGGAGGADVTYDLVV